LTVKQLPIGSVIVGGAWQGVGDYKTGAKRPTVASIAGNLHLAIRTIPALKNLTVLRTWASFDCHSPDRLPLIGRIFEDPPLAVAIPGFSGFTTGPEIGAIAAQVVLGGQLPTYAQEFDVHRILSAAANSPNVS
jgi:glycine/D-amino acid oxidase-like deaminating enzyme